MANIKFSAFTQKVASADVDFLVGYTGGDNVRITPSVFDDRYLPLAGGTMTGDTNHGDSVYSYWGASNDLQIYHDGSNSFIDDSGTGDLRIRSNFLKIEKYTGETMATFNDDNSVALYFNNSIKFETTNTGVKIIGINQYADNAAALAGGLTVGDVYRTGDLLKIVN